MCLAPETRVLTVTRSEPPKYQWIAQDLQARIAAAEWSPGDKLPSQQTLASEYSVTLMTLRQAIRELEDQGIVQASKGIGTFVTNQSVRYQLNHLSSFTEEMEAQGVQLHTEVLSTLHNSDRQTLTPEYIALFESVRTSLGLTPASGVVELTRRRRTDRGPVALQRSYMAAHHWRQVENADLTKASLYETLATDAGLSPHRATETLTAVQLSERDARQLQRPPGSPAILSIRLSLGSDDRPFLLDRALLPGDNTEIHAERHADHLALNYQLNK